MAIKDGIAAMQKLPNPLSRILYLLQNRFVSFLLPYLNLFCCFMFCIIFSRSSSITRSCETKIGWIRWLCCSMSAKIYTTGKILQMTLFAYFLTQPLVFILFTLKALCMYNIILSNIRQLQELVACINI